MFSSPHTRLVADAHKLPFVDQSFDGVWIQAVLEHVLEPIDVVSEIHRVLRDDGLVYAETPFMQQVHERAYDFTRFTQSGHRWLFRSFTEISAGPVTGGGVALLWSIRYLFRAFGVGVRRKLQQPLMPRPRGLSVAGAVRGLRRPGDGAVAPVGAAGAGATSASVVTGVDGPGAGVENGDLQTAHREDAPLAHRDLVRVAQGDFGSFGCHHSSH